MKHILTHLALAAIAADANSPVFNRRHSGGSFHIVGDPYDALMGDPSARMTGSPSIDEIVQTGDVVVRLSPNEIGDVNAANLSARSDDFGVPAKNMGPGPALSRESIANLGRPVGAGVIRSSDRFFFLDPSGFNIQDAPILTDKTFGIPGMQNLLTNMTVGFGTKPTYLSYGQGTNGASNTLSINITDAETGLVTGQIAVAPLIRIDISQQMLNSVSSGYITVNVQGVLLDKSSFNATLTLQYGQVINGCITIVPWVLVKNEPTPSAFVFQAGAPTNDLSVTISNLTNTVTASVSAYGAQHPFINTIRHTIFNVK